MEVEVLMSCYKNDNPLFLREAIESTYDNQSRKPDSFRIIVDGPVGSEIDEVLIEYENKYPGIFKIERLKVNGGLGNALRRGIQISSYEYILRMDSDDVSEPERIRKQVEYAEKHPEVDVIGTFTADFLEKPDKPLSIRALKTDMKSISEDAKKRTPVSHVSVLLKRESVLAAGNYQDFRLYEDYYLWVRMLKNRAVFVNIPEVLVKVRTGADRYKRKGSKQYIYSTKKFQHYLYGIGFISKKEYLRNRWGRVIVARIPVFMRKAIYETFLRKKIER